MKRDRLKELYVRSDLACESGRCAPADTEGVCYSRREDGGVTVERLEVTNEKGQAATGKKQGSYVTVSGKAVSAGSGEKLKKAVGDEITRLCEKAMGKKITPKTSVMIAGLGNEEISADALGALCGAKIPATRHIEPSVREETLGCCDVSVLKTSVLGKTGMEAFEIIKGAVLNVSPDVLIVIDSLAAGSVSRLGTTLQLSDTGIMPGSGIGNSRHAIDRESLGLPVIALGVPTVVSSAVLVFDALDAAGIEDIDDSLVNILEDGKSFFVCPKDCDIINERLSDVISGALCGVFGLTGL